MTKASNRKSPKRSATSKKLAKVAAKKTTAKKTIAKKKTTSKEAAAKVLICANENECFWTTDGQIIADLHELESALGAMAEDVFSYHVSKEKNDFADWVNQVLRDAECAAALRRTRKPATAQKVVIRHLKLYS